MQGRKSRLRAFLPRWGSEREPGLRPGPLPRERADADRGSWLTLQTLPDPFSFTASNLELHPSDFSGSWEQASLWDLSWL